MGHAHWGHRGFDKRLNIDPFFMFTLDCAVEGANAIVNHSLRAALTGAIAIIKFSKDADPRWGAASRH